MINLSSTQRNHLFSSAYWKMLLARFRDWRARRARRVLPITDRDGLGHFISTRAAHVAQNALYGYLRTRAGTRFPELFSNDEFVFSINIAKWHVWLACVSDLAVFAGGLVSRQAHAQAPEVTRLMEGVVDSLLQKIGVPADSGKDYESHASRIRARIALCDWAALPEGEAPFSQSPAALVQWAPIVDELKQLDSEIVHNSVRFRWQEVRRELNRLLDAEALMASTQPAVATGPVSSDIDRP